MHGATADAPPQIFTFPRRPPNAESTKGGESDGESESSDAYSLGGRDTSAEDERGAAPCSSSKTSSGGSSSSSRDTSLAAVSGSHAGSDRAVTWSAKDDAAAG